MWCKLSLCRKGSTVDRWWQERLSSLPRFKIKQSVFSAAAEEICNIPVRGIQRSRVCIVTPDQTRLPNLAVATTR